MSYPETVGTPPIPKKFLFVSDIHEPHLCIASALTPTTSFSLCLWLLRACSILQCDVFDKKIGSSGRNSEWFHLLHAEVSWMSIIAFYSLLSSSMSNLALFALLSTVANVKDSNWPCMPASKPADIYVPSALTTCTPPPPPQTCSHLLHIVVGSEDNCGDVGNECFMSKVFGCHISLAIVSQTSVVTMQK